MRSGRENPYVGLDYFIEDDAEVFFGRDAERKRIIGNLRTSRLTLLYAQSGVGKSSLLRAGVAARLRAQGQRAAAQRGSPRYLPVVFSAWRDDPVAALVNEIDVAVRPFLTDGADLELPRERLDDAVQVAADAIDATPLVILDQFEEFFLYHECDEAGQRFADALARCLHRPDVRAHFLLSIREDSYSRIGDHFKDRIPNVYANYLHLDYIDERAGRDAIREPLGRLAASFGSDAGPTAIQDELVDEVLRQVRRPGTSAGSGNGTGDTGRFETAYLQLVMERLWDEEKQQGSDKLRLETLTQFGGAQTIIRSHLDEAVGDLGLGERDAAAAAFRFLVTSGGTKIALTTSELAEFTEQPEPLIESALEHLRNNRILRPVALDGNRSGYELFHDVLGEAVVEWRKRHEAERHEQALLADREEQERQKLAQAAERHAAQRAILVRRAAVGLSLLAVVLAGAVVWALVERHAAQQAREQARSEGLAASAIAQLPVDPESSVLLARQAWKTAHTDRADDALRRSLSASLVRDKFGVGVPRWGTALSNGGETLVTLEPTRLSVWGPDRSAGRQPAQRPAGGPRLSSHPVTTRNDRVLSVGATGATVAFASGKQTRVVRATRGAEPVILERSGTFPIALSRDGRYAAGVDRDQVARVWNVGTGRMLALPAGGRSALAPSDSLAFDPTDSAHVVAGECRGRLTSWRWRSGKVKRLRATGSPPKAIDPGATCHIAVSPDGRRAVEARGSAVLWNLDSGRSVETRIGDGHTVNDIAFSRDGRRVVTASRKSATAFDTRTGKRVSRLTGHANWVHSVAFSPTGDRVLTSSADGTARVWDVATGALLAVLQGHADEVLDAAFTRTGEDVLTVSSDGTARRWRVATGHTLRGHQDWVLDAALAPDGRQVATVDVRGRLLLHDLSTDQDRIRRRPPGKLAFHELKSVAYDPSGKRIVLAGRIDRSGRRNGQVLVIDARTGDQRHGFLHGSTAYSASFSPNGQWLLAGHGERPQLWRLRDEKQFELPTPKSSRTAAAAFSPDGRSIVTAGDDGVARIFDTATRKQRPVTYRHRGLLSGATFSPDGRTVMTFGSDATAQLWDPVTGQTRHILRGHTGWISSGAFSADGRRVVTGGTDQTTRVWDAATGKPLSTQRMHGDFVNSVAFAPDGRTILSASDDRTARIYPCATCESTDDLFQLSRSRVFFTPGERREILAGDH